MRCGLSALLVSGDAGARSAAQTLPMRRPYPAQTAAAELGFAIAAFGCGLYDAPLWSIGLATFGMLAYWTWSRRAWLNRLRGKAWMVLSINAALVLIAIMGGAYWLGLSI